LDAGSAGGDTDFAEESPTYFPNTFFSRLVTCADGFVRISFSCCPRT